jgi:monoamine oxidase
MGGTEIPGGWRWSGVMGASSSDLQHVQNDVVVVGAGIAGLAAARALAEKGMRVVVVEARERVGGRVLSVPVQGGAVELGAEFVHGRAPELWSLMEEAGVQTVERGGVMLREGEGGLGEDDDAGDEMFAPLAELEDDKGPDVPFAQWLETSDVQPWARVALTGYVEGFNAADAGRIGVRALGAQQKAEDAIEGDRAWHVHGGYAQLAAFLAERAAAAGAELRMGCTLQRMAWRAGAVTCATSAGDLHARRAVITLPLGVLHRVNQAGGIRMEPEPAAVAQARRLAMGHATRFTLRFRDRWWRTSALAERDALERMSFLFTPTRMPPVWWTSGGESEVFPSLTGWVGGPRAEALEGLTSEELGRRACETLAGVFDLPAERIRASLLETHTHDWAADPFSCGAYSYVPAGALDAPEAMSQPEEGTLYFAGEHTDVTGHWGTVHAALRSGMRAAEQVLGEL